jgi:hypothetical protein
MPREHPEVQARSASVGYKIPIPSKDDLAAWERLHADLREAKRALVLDQEKERVGLTHDLERRLQRLEAQPTNPGRERAIRDLKKRLDELRR